MCQKYDLHLFQHTSKRFFQLDRHDADYLSNIQWIKSNGPYSHFFTVTFPSRIPDLGKYELCNRLLRRMNKSIYGRYWNKIGCYLQGFCFVEKQLNGAIHFHLIIRHDEEFYVEGKRSLRGHFLDQAMALGAVPPRVRKVGAPKGLDCQPIFSNDDINIKEGFYLRGKGDDLIHYCLKKTRFSQNLHVDKGAYRRVNAIGPEGFSARLN